MFTSCGRRTVLIEVSTDDNELLKCLSEIETAAEDLQQKVHELCRKLNGSAVDERAEAAKNDGSC